MATYYVSAAASGGGAGTIGDPFTLPECDASAGNVSAGDKVYILADDVYALSADLALTVGTETACTKYETYAVTPGDGGRATINLGNYGLTIGAYSHWLYGDLNATKSDSDDVITLATTAVLERAYVTSTRTGGYPAVINGKGTLVRNKIIVAGASATGSNAFLTGRESRWTGNYIRIDTGQELSGCGVAIGNVFHSTVAGGGGLQLGGSYSTGGVAVGNVIYGFGTYGLSVSIGSGDAWANGQVSQNVIWNCGTYGIQTQGTGGAALSLFRNAIGDCTSGRTNLLFGEETEGITLTEDPFVDAANGDFRLNDAAGGGRLLKFRGIGAMQV